MNDNDQSEWEMISAWERGNVQQMDEIFQDGMKKPSPTLYKRLVVQRNNNWMPRINKLFSGPHTPIVIVGAGHIIGSSGLAAKLRQQGYKVSQL